MSSGTMKVLFAAVLIQSGAFASMGAIIPPSPIYINNSPTVTAPQVDATVFWNRSAMSLSTLYPFQAQDVQYWTNNGVMSGFPGFLFEYDVDRKTALRLRPRSRSLQRPSVSFHNSGIIAGDPILSVNAKSIVNPGRLDGGEFSVISLLASNGSADVSRGTLRTGPPTGTFVNCDFGSTETNFLTDQHITGLYWGNGRNNALGTNGRPLRLDQAFSFFNPISPRSPSHEVRVPRSTFTNTVIVPGFLGCNSAYEAFVFTNGSGTNMSVSIAIVPTNSLIEFSNLDVAVRFTEVFNRRGTESFPAPVVEFRSIDFDIVDQALVTNYVTLVATTGSETNVLLGRPFVTGTGTSSERRPTGINLIYGRLCNFDIPFIAQEANSVFDPFLFYDPVNSQTNTVDTIYAAYSAQIGQSNSQTLVSTPTITVGPTLVPFLPGVNPALSDPTNFTGRVEIKAGNLNLANTRIRAQNFVNIKADNLVSNVLAQIDAPFYSFDVQSTNSELVIENFAPATVNRLVGRISAYSTAWTSRVTNSAQVHEIRFQVLLVENCLRSTTPVAVHNFSVNTPALILKDNIIVNHSASIKTKALLVDSNVTLALPPGSDLAFTNVNNLLNFTNYGTVSVAGGAYFGTFDTGHVPQPPKRRRRRFPPPPSPLDNFVNHGVLSAQSLFVRATNAEIAGLPSFPAFYIATQGVMYVSASTVSLTNIVVAGGTDVDFHANDLIVSGTTISAGISNGAFSVRGALVLDATNSFGDFETTSTNYWQVTAGVRIPTRPVNAGDLMQTQIRSTSGPFWETPIVWAGEDRGPVVEGYVNNLALGLLTLDAKPGNLLHFSGAGASNALYVDYLELLNDATNFNFVLGVDPDFTLYFADSNISPEKLDQSGGGRIRWVNQFTGPRSSTNLTYPDGSVHTFNAGLVRSKDRDDDGDGVVNFEDCTPLPVPGFDSTQPCAGPDRAKSIALSTQQIGLTIAHASGGQGVVLSWDAPAGSANTVEFTDSLADPKWTVFKSFINGPENARVTVKDAVAAPLRVYRVRVDAGKP